MPKIQFSTAGGLTEDVVACRTGCAVSEDWPRAKSRAKLNEAKDLVNILSLSKDLILFTIIFGRRSIGMVEKASSDLEWLCNMVSLSGVTEVVIEVGRLAVCMVEERNMGVMLVDGHLYISGK